MTLGELQVCLRELRHEIEREAEEEVFINIPQSKLARVRESSPQWTPILSVFTNTFEDVQDSQDCFAVGKDTAAVFHLMRVAEWGLRALCIHFGLRRIKSKIKATGKVELTPIEYAVWELLLGQLHAKVRTRILKLKRGSTKQKAQELYYPLLEDVQAFKEAWRNHVMHSRKSYTPEDVLAIASHVRRFMGTLAANGISQV